MLTSREFDDYNLLVHDKKLPHNVGDFVLVTFCDTIGLEQHDVWLRQENIPLDYDDDEPEYMTINNEKFYMGVDETDEPFIYTDNTIKESRQA